MPLINPKAHADSAKRQKELRELPPVPPRGRYVLVNVKAERSSVGKKKTKKIDFTTHVLAVLDPLHLLADKDKPNGPKAKQDPLSADFVDATARITFWANWDNPKSVREISWLALACNVDSEFDPDDDKGLLMVTGVPYVAEFDIVARDYQDKNRNKATSHDIAMVEVIALSTADRKKYMSRPDWSKIVGDPDKRITEREQQSSSEGGYPDDDGDPGHGAGASAGGDSDPFG